MPSPCSDEDESERRCSLGLGGLLDTGIFLIKKNRRAAGLYSAEGSIRRKEGDGGNAKGRVGLPLP